MALELWCFKWKNEGCPLVILQQLICDNMLSDDNDFHLFFACFYKEMLNAVDGALNAFGSVIRIPI